MAQLYRQRRKDLGSLGVPLERVSRRVDRRHRIVAGQRWSVAPGLQVRAADPVRRTRGRFGDLRDAAWYIDWLRRDPSYSFQPYQQLAKVLEAYGEDGKANKVLIAGRERERMQLPWWSPEGWWLLALRLLIGYGYGAGELLALIWAIPLIWTGGVVAQSKGQPRSNDERPGFWYSLDMLLPGIWLSQRHTKFELDGRARYYFYVHRLVGYVLLFFVVAGLAGLTE